MTASKEFSEKYTEEYLRKYYIDKVQFKCTPGIDRVTRATFENTLPTTIRNISKKICNGTYNFTPYKERLLIKGKNKYPRIISIPSIRDKITLGILKGIIFNSFNNEIYFKIVQSIINEIRQVICDPSNSYDYFIKIDMENFFGSLDHNFLLHKVRKKIRKKEILSLIEKAISTPTVTGSDRLEGKSKNVKGVPQGLPISNILSSVYLSSFDRCHSNSASYKYFRYVDDILILCNESNAQMLKNKIYSQINDKFLLKANYDKGDDNKISEGFNYLGYFIRNKNVTVRLSSKKKIEQSLEKLFLQFKHSKFKNIDFFVWQLNLKITGCIKDNKKYGWMFFFSQIDDTKLLYHLDWLTQRLLDRFGVEKLVRDLEIKRFVRTFNEILYKLNTTKYIPNFDLYTLEDKIEFLTNIVGKNISDMTDIEVSVEFDKVLFKSLEELEKDIQDFS